MRLFLAIITILLCSCSTPSELQSISLDGVWVPDWDATIEASSAHSNDAYVAAMSLRNAWENTDVYTHLFRDGTSWHQAPAANWYLVGTWSVADKQLEIRTHFFHDPESRENTSQFVIQDHQLVYVLDKDVYGPVMVYKRANAPREDKRNWTVDQVYKADSP